MRRLITLVLVLVLLPGVAYASDLDQLLQRGHDAAYSAEQIITCSTPEGVSDAVVRISQSGGDLRMSAQVSSDVEVTSGYGGWALSRAGSVISSTELVTSGEALTPRYVVDDGTAAAFLGRRATLYEMRDGDLLRAQLIFDNSTGALMRAVTYTGDGSVYCERRFISFNPARPLIPTSPINDADHPAQTESVGEMPDELAGFHRLDLYADEQGFVFGYYSDGFFSFAVFETPSLVVLPDATDALMGEHMYGRSFTPGLVTYAWETAGGAMALVGDLPPDMHQQVLEGLPAPVQRGWWGRLWRSLFG